MQINWNIFINFWVKTFVIASFSQLKFPLFTAVTNLFSVIADIKMREKEEEKLKQSKGRWWKFYSFVKFFYDRDVKRLISSLTTSIERWNTHAHAIHTSSSFLFIYVIINNSFLCHTWKTKYFWLKGTKKLYKIP